MSQKLRLLSRSLQDDLLHRIGDKQSSANLQFPYYGLDGIDEPSLLQRRAVAASAKASASS